MLKGYALGGYALVHRTTSNRDIEVPVPEEARQLGFEQHNLLQGHPQDPCTGLQAEARQRLQRLRNVHGCTATSGVCPVQQLVKDVRVRCGGVRHLR